MLNFYVDAKMLSICLCFQEHVDDHLFVWATRASILSKFNLPALCYENEQGLRSLTEPVNRIKWFMFM